jgi:RHS repeat-associated protein
MAVGTTCSAGTCSGSTVYSYSVGYTGDSDVLSATDSVNGTWSYSYDGFNRLTASNCTTNCPDGPSMQGFSYGYDRYGNRWSQAVTNGQGGVSQLTFTGPGNHIDGYSYDAAGNLLNDTFHSYTYDAENRIISVDNGATTYIYDADGQRVEKNTGGATLDYNYDREGRVLIYNPPNSTQSEVYAAGLHLGTYILNSAGTDTIFYYDHSDWLGTERARIDLSGTACEKITSMPFGDGQTVTSTCGDISPMHFTGKERDSESGLDMFGARYYGSSLGRFMTPDWAAKPIDVPYADFGNPQSLNLYSYVKNNPTATRDEDGHCPDGICQNIATASPDRVDEQGEASSDAVVGAAKGLWNMVAGAWNTGAELLNAQTAASSSTGTPYGVPTLPMAQPTNITQAVSGAVAQTAVVISGTVGESKPAVPEEIPAGPSARPTAAQQSAINEMGEAHGCSTCGAPTPGTKSGNWVGDHQPPTALNNDGGPQVYRPQCLQCSRQQGGQVAAAVRAAKRQDQPQQ